MIEAMSRVEARDEKKTRPYADGNREIKFDYGDGERENRENEIACACGASGI